MSIHVLDTPEWTSRQVLLEALADADAVELTIVLSRRHDGTWRTLHNSAADTGYLLTAAEVLRERATKWLRD